MMAARESPVAREWGATCKSATMCTRGRQLPVLVPVPVPVPVPVFSDNMFGRPHGRGRNTRSSMLVGACRLRPVRITITDYDYITPTRHRGQHKCWRSGALSALSSARQASDSTPRSSIFCYFYLLCFSRTHLFFFTFSSCSGFRSGVIARSRLPYYTSLSVFYTSTLILSIFGKKCVQNFFF